MPLAIGVLYIAGAALMIAGVALPSVKWALAGIVVESLAIVGSFICILLILGGAQ